MLVIPVPGTTGLSIPNAPKIVVKDYEAKLAALPGLSFVIDPDLFGPDTLVARDRIAGLDVNIGSTDRWTASSALLNDRPAFVLPSKTSTVGMAAGAQRATQTVIVVAALTALTDTGLTYNGPAALQYKSSSFQAFSHPLYVSVPSVVPAVNTPFIAACSVDYASLELFAYAWQSGSAPGEAIGVRASSPDDATVLGSPFQIGRTNLSVPGHYGLAIGFSEALHLPGNRGRFDDAVGMLAEYYGIT